MESIIRQQILHDPIAPNLVVLTLNERMNLKLKKPKQKNKTFSPFLIVLSKLLQVYPGNEWFANVILPILVRNLSDGQVIIAITTKNSTCSEGSYPPVQVTSGTIVLDRHTGALLQQRNTGSRHAHAVKTYSPALLISLNIFIFITQGKQSYKDGNTYIHVLSKHLTSSLCPNTKLEDKMLTNQNDYFLDLSKYCPICLLIQQKYTECCEPSAPNRSKIMQKHITVQTPQ